MEETKKKKPKDAALNRAEREGPDRKNVAQRVKRRHQSYGVGGILKYTPLLDHSTLASEGRKPSLRKK